MSFLTLLYAHSGLEPEAEEEERVRDISQTYVETWQLEDARWLICERHLELQRFVIGKHVFSAHPRGAPFFSGPSFMPLVPFTILKSQNNTEKQ